MANTDIRKLLKKSGIKLWEIADYFGVSEATITRWMRHDLPENIENAIREYVHEQGELK